MIILVLFLGVAFNLDLGNAGNIAILMASAFGAYNAFIKENKRLLSKKEKRKMIWGSLLISWIISLVFTAVVILLNNADSELNALKSMPIWGWVGIVIFVSLIYLIMLAGFFYSDWMGRNFLKGLEKRVAKKNIKT